MDHQNAKCVKCESNNLYVFIRQINHNDERPTKYYRCLVCQYAWKQSVEIPDA